MPKKKSKTSLQREVARLKEKKKKALKLKKELLLRQKEINEIKQLEREVKLLEGVGTKRRLAKEVSMQMGKQAGRFGLKGLKFAGKLIKNRLEAEAREQAMDRARAMAKVKTRTVVKGKGKRKLK